MDNRSDPTYARLDQLEREFSGMLGVAAANLGPGRWDKVSWNAREPFPTASVIKVPILFTCLRLVDRGIMQLDQRVPLQEEELVAGSGVLRDLSPGTEITLNDLLTLMIIVSDNTATNLVIDLIGGPERVNEDLEEFGLKSTRLVGKLMLPPEKRNAAQRAGMISQTTPQDMLRSMQLLFRGEGLSSESTRVAHKIMHRQHDTDSLTRHLPWARAQSDEPWRIAAKSGSIQGVRNQVGWIETKTGRFAFAILTQGSDDRRFYSESEGNIAVAKAFRVLYDHYFAGS